MTNTHNKESWEEEFDKLIKPIDITRGETGMFIEQALGGESRNRLRLFFKKAMEATREESYDKGAMEASMVCNEKTIPQVVKETREDTLKEVGEIVESKEPAPDLDTYLDLVKNGNRDDMYDYGVRIERDRIRSALTTLSEKIKGMK